MSCVDHIIFSMIIITINYLLTINNNFIRHLTHKYRRVTMPTMMLIVTQPSLVALVKALQVRLKRMDFKMASNTYNLLIELVVPLVFLSLVIFCNKCQVKYEDKLYHKENTY